MKIAKMFNLDTTETVVGSDKAAKPLCPHCSEALQKIVTHRSDYIGVTNLHVFSCPHCRKVIGQSVVTK